MASVATQTDSSTFLFADPAGFTALTEAHGDAAAIEIATQFAARMRNLQGLILLSDRFAHSLMPAKHRLFSAEHHGKRRVSFHVGIELLQQRVEVPAVVRAEPTLEVRRSPATSPTPKAPRR